MNHARAQALLRGQTAVAQKIYQAVPIAEPWGTSQIIAELRRLGSNMEYHIAAGCIAALVEAGLVISKGKDLFYRTPVRQPTASLAGGPAESAPIPLTPVDALVMSTTLPAKPAATSPIDKLTALSGRVLDLSRELHKLASDIDTAALEIEEQMQAKAAEGAKLRQLQAILKEIA